MTKRISRDIKRARKIIGLSQYQLAKKAGLTPASISLIENGSREPSITTLEKISNALGVKISYFTRDLSNQITPEMDSQMSSLTHDEKKTINEFLEYLNHSQEE